MSKRYAIVVSELEMQMNSLPQQRADLLFVRFHAAKKKPWLTRFFALFI